MKSPASSKWPFDSPNGGHVFTPEKVTNKTPKKLTRKRVGFFRGSTESHWFSLRNTPILGSNLMTSASEGHLIFQLVQGRFREQIMEL